MSTLVRARPLPSIKATTAAAIMAVVLAGCGSATSSQVADGGSTGSPTPTTSPPASPPSSSSTPDPSAGWPGCSQVWQTGAKLPAAYRGCNAGSTAVEAVRIACSSGQTIVPYANHFYAVLGGLIRHSGDLKHDATYIHSIQVCRG